MIQSGMTIDKEVKIMGQIGAMAGSTRAYLGKQQPIDNKINLDRFFALPVRAIV